MKRNFVIGGLILAIATIAGIARSVGSFDGVIFVSNAKYLQGERFPAAIRRVFDYSQFEGEPLKIRSLKRLISDAQVVAKSGSVGLELGHFVTRGDDGQGQLACEFYDQVILKFEGQGIMEFGDKPVMTIEAPCQISADINRIETIWIPALRLMEENKEPSRFFEVSYPELKDVHFKFDEMTSEWPREWNLVSVRLHSDSSTGREVTISRTEIAETLEHNLTIRF